MSRAILAFREQRQAFRRHGGECAVCGKVFTENIGTEKVVKNLGANRHIRFLILCGKEAKGHQTGARIKALQANEVDSRRIVGAPGNRPWIKSLSSTQFTCFQWRIKIVDLIGCEDVAFIHLA